MLVQWKKMMMLLRLLLLPKMIANLLMLLAASSRWSEFDERVERNAATQRDSDTATLLLLVLAILSHFTASRHGCSLFSISFFCCCWNGTYFRVPHSILAERRLHCTSTVLYRSVEVVRPNACIYYCLSACPSLGGTGLQL